MVRRYALRDDQWERIKAMLPSTDEWVRKTIVCSWIQCSTVTVRAYLGGTFPKVLTGTVEDFKKALTKQHMANKLEVMAINVPKKF